MGEQGEQPIYNEEYLLHLTDLMAVQLSVLAFQGQHEYPNMNLFLWFNRVSQVEGKDAIWHLRNKQRSLINIAEHSESTNASNT